jgi:hypothetical protein
MEVYVICQLFGTTAALQHPLVQSFIYILILLNFSRHILQGLLRRFLIIEGNTITTENGFKKCKMHICLQKNEV